jgi:hypothetical protein
LCVRHHVKLTLHPYRLWVDVRGGVEHLAAMVACLPLPAGALPVPLSDDTLQDVLAQVWVR